MKLFSSRHGIALISLAGLFVLIHIWAYVSRPESTLPLYYAWPSVDIPVHMIFGAWLTLFFLYPNVLRRKEPLRIFFIVMLIGIGWEFIEYGFDTFYGLPHGLHAMHHGMGDTYKDIFDNGVGAVVVLFFMRARTVNEHSNVQ